MCGYIASTPRRMSLAKISAEAQKIATEKLRVLRLLEKVSENPIFTVERERLKAVLISLNEQSERLRLELDKHKGR